MSVCKELPVLTNTVFKFLGGCENKIVRFQCQKALFSTACHHSSSLQNPWEVSNQPETVKYNVKYHHHDTLEFNFQKLYPDIVHFLAKDKEGEKCRIHESRITKLLARNMSTTVMGKRYGLLVPRTFMKLTDDKSLLGKALTLGWAVEVHRAANNIKLELYDDRPRRQEEVPHKTGQGHDFLSRTSINHALMMSTGVFSLLSEELEGQPCHLSCQNAFIESMKRQAWALNMDPKLDDNPDPLSGYDVNRFKNMTYNTKTYPNLVLPVMLGINLAGFDQREHPTVHKLAVDILRKIGIVDQVRRNYECCFELDREIAYESISRGRCTWPIVLARQRANTSQLNQLRKDYGSSDMQAVDRVLQIYHDLRLEKQISKFVEAMIEEIERDIHRVSNSEILPQKLFFKIHAEISNRQGLTFIHPSYGNN